MEDKKLLTAYLSVPEYLTLRELCDEIENDTELYSSKVIQDIQENIEHKRSGLRIAENTVEDIRKQIDFLYEMKDKIYTVKARLKEERRGNKT